MANIVFDFLHNYETGERRESEPASTYQFDEGHVIEAILPEAVTSCEVHYWIRGQEKSAAYTPGSITVNDDRSCTVTCNVPNLYFETNGELRVYIVVTDGDASITTYEGYVHVCQRSMPDDYVDDDPDNEATRVLVEARAAAATARAAAEDARESAQSARGLTEDVKQALLQIAEKVAYIDEDGQDYYDDLYDALYAVTAIRLDAQSIMLTSIGSTQQLTATTTPAGGTVTWASSNTSIATVSDTGLVTSVGYGSCTITASSGSVSASCAVDVSQVTLASISADYQQSGTVYDTASLDSLKNDLTVTATYSDSSTATVTEYTLSGTLTAGTSAITVSYGGKTTTFTVTVTAAPTLTSISAVYTQSGTVYDTDNLDTLKSDLVVTAHMSDSTTQTVTDYVLSGTLTAGTSTITVTYEGKTTTFTVTVSATSGTISVPLTIKKTIINMATGATSSNSSWYASDFVEIPSGMAKVKYSNETGGSVSFRGAFYDSSNSYISSDLSSVWTINNGATGTVNVPSAAKYIRLSTNASAIFNTTITLMASAI